MAQSVPNRYVVLVHLCMYAWIHMDMSVLVCDGWLLYVMYMCCKCHIIESIDHDDENTSTHGGTYNSVYYVTHIDTHSDTYICTLVHQKKLLVKAQLMINMK